MERGEVHSTSTMVKRASQPTHPLLPHRDLAPSLFLLFHQWPSPPSPNPCSGEEVRKGGPGRVMERRRARVVVAARWREGAREEAWLRDGEEAHAGGHGRVLAWRRGGVLVGAANCGEDVCLPMCGPWQRGGTLACVWPVAERRYARSPAIWIWGGRKWEEVLIRI
jgi:hypothetical protein